MYVCNQTVTFSNNHVLNIYYVYMHKYMCIYICIYIIFFIYSIFDVIFLPLSVVVYNFHFCWTFFTTTTLHNSQPETAIEFVEFCNLSLCRCFSRMKYVHMYIHTYYVVWVTSQSLQPHVKRGTIICYIVLFVTTLYRALPLFVEHLENELSESPVPS